MVVMDDTFLSAEWETGSWYELLHMHLGEKSSEIEIILAVRMEFLFGVIFD